MDDQQDFVTIQAENIHTRRAKIGNVTFKDGLQVLSFPYEYEASDSEPSMTDIIRGSLVELMEYHADREVTDYAIVAVGLDGSQFVSKWVTALPLAVLPEVVKTALVIDLSAQVKAFTAGDVDSLPE